MSNTNLHQGRRQRLRSRYSNLGPNGLLEHELLELALYYCIPRSNVGAIARAAIEKFGSFEKVLASSEEELCTIDGIGKRAAEYLRFLSLIGSEAMMRGELLKGNFDLFESVGEYFLELFNSKCSKSETIAFVYLSENQKVIHVEIKPFENNSASDYSAERIQKILTCAQKYNSSYVALAHNHRKEGEIVPSEDDVGFTFALQNVLKERNITLVEHMIVFEKSKREQSYYCILRGEEHVLKTKR